MELEAEAKNILLLLQSTSLITTCIEKHCTWPTSAASGSKHKYSVISGVAWEGGRRGRTASGGTSMGGVFYGVVTCYVYPSLCIATSDLYLLIY